MADKRQLQCPQCSTILDVDDLLISNYQRELEDRLGKQKREMEGAFAQKNKKLQEQLVQEREERERAFAQKNEAIEQREKEFEEKRKNQNKLFKQKLSEALLTERSQLESNIQKEYAQRDQKLQEELKAKDAKMTELIEAQMQLEKYQREENLRKKEQEAEFEKRLYAQRSAIEKNITDREKGKSDMKIAELQKQLEDQKKLAEEMKRKAEQGSMQLQGEVLELAIEDELRRRFPMDIISEVSKGVRGADLMQSVVNELRQVSGTIIIESKRTKTWSEPWIAKLKDDQRLNGGDIAVLITEAMPRDQPTMGLRSGIYVCGYHEYADLISVLRTMLMKVHQARSAGENKGDKMEMLYNFLTSEEFKQQMVSILDGFTNLKSELDREKRAMKRIWKEREKQIERVLDGTIDMHASLQSISGYSLPPIDQLQLPDGD